LSLNIKVDEDLPLKIPEMLRRAGHNVETVIGQGMGGAKDPVLWQSVQSEQRFLITADKGFADIRRYPPGTHNGVLLLRPDEDGIEPLVDLVRRVLRGEGLDRLRGTVTVVTPRAIRIRKP
jgi:predicted nuclease of predicted toxin-antitoxin system